ncbi:carbohydrate ABC transporter permease [Eisenbergiella tayi]|uniref:carbohydrate ABC transporter permease n=1 Tax=Eisenbergiella tayi TaxID=1432052 RepID=UPI000848EF4D|nr:carbohydrate ABC transporter permease [Eisenbergiella tayi]ODR28292.1 ABC transporter permease [Eisenbergiella tayi]
MTDIRYGNKVKKMSVGDKLYNGIFGLVFAILGLICIFPFYYLVICTISSPQLVETGKIIFLPKEITFSNYQEIMKVQNLGSSALVTLARTVIGTASNLFCTAYLAYFFTKADMWARKFWYRMVVATMYFSAGMIPIYLNNRMLGLNNTFWIYIIPGLVGVYNMILVKTSIESLPAELEESAVLDGAGYLTRLFRIVLPLQKPILATVGLFTAVGHWNDFFTTQLYINKPELYTLQFLLYEFLQQIKNATAQISSATASLGGTSNVQPTSIRLTLTAIVILPIMLVYPFIQKYYVKGVMIGAVKG